MRGALRVLPLAGAIACSTIVGADFDDLEVAPPGGSGGTMRGGNGGGGGNTSSAAAAGVESQGGDTSSAGASNGGGEGGVGGSPSGGGQGGEPSGGQSAGGMPGQGGGGQGGSDNGGGQGGSGACDGVGGALSEDAVVALNEVKGEGAGDDYIELYNNGPGAFDLADYRVADSNNTFIFPSCTIIPEGGYVLLLLGDALIPGGSHECFVPNGICFHETWGISQDGEDVFFRDPDNQVINTTFYPDNVANGDSWGRLPNGTGGFAMTALTPQEENEAP